MSLDEIEAEIEKLARLAKAWFGMTCAMKEEWPVVEGKEWEAVRDFGLGQNVSKATLRGLQKRGLIEVGVAPRAFFEAEEVAVLIGDWLCKHLPCGIMVAKLTGLGEELVQWLESVKGERHG